MTGYTGQILDVDLTRKTFRIVRSDEIVTADGALPPFRRFGLPPHDRKIRWRAKRNEKLSESQKGRDVIPSGSSIEGVRSVGLGLVNIYSIAACFWLYEPSMVAQAINHGRSKDIGRCSG